MSVFAAIAVLITLTALFSYYSERSLRLPTPVGVMLGALIASLGLVLFGGVSVALALAVPVTAGRDLLLAMTYGVVVFSIVVQGLTICRLTRGLLPDGACPEAHRGVAGHRASSRS